MTFDPEYAGAEPVHTSSQTDHTLTELQLYGWRPFQDEPDPRPLPEGNTVAAAVTNLSITVSNGKVTAITINGSTTPAE